MKIKLIATDIDGTLFNNKKELSDYTEKVFNRIKKDDIITVISTGRPLSGIKNLCDSGLFDYAITCNGTAIYRIKDQKKVYQNLMPKHLVSSVLDIFSKYDYPIEVFIDGKTYTTKEYYNNAQILNVPKHMITYVQNTRIPVDNIYDFAYEHIHEIEMIDMVIDDPVLRDQIRIIVEQFNDIYVTSSVSHYIECCHSTAHKGFAVASLGNILNIKNENMIAFGDGENDLSMILTAGLGVAMANGHPLIKAQADIIADTNDHDGVAKMLVTQLGLDGDLDV